MDKIKTFLNFNFTSCWYLFFVSICSILIIWVINGKKEKNNLMKELKKVANLYISSIIMILLLNNIVPLFFKRNISIYTQFLFEVFSWATIIFYFIRNGKGKKIYTKYKKYQIIILVSFFIGIVFLIIMMFGNFKYVYPTNENGIIGNFYFNADITRSASEIFLGELNKIHPCFRFLLLPVTIIFTAIYVLFRIINRSTYNLNISLNYYMVLIQIILNSISAVFMYKIMEKKGFNRFILNLSIILFIGSLAFAWISVLPETYSLTLLFMIITYYLYIIGRKEWIAAGALAISSNLFSILVVGMLGINEIFKNKNEIMGKIKGKINKKYFKFIIIGILIFIIASVIFCSSYLTRWADQKSDIVQKIKYSFSYIVSTWLLGPNVIENTPYLVQSRQMNIFQWIIMLFWCAVAIIGIIKNKKEKMIWFSLINLFVAYILHVIFGYGLYIGIIYSALYTWTFIFLIAYGMKYILNRMNNKIMKLVFIIFTTTVCIYNLIWVVNLSMKVNKIEFKNGNKEKDVYAYLTDDVGQTNEYIIKDNKIIRTANQEVIIDGLDGYVYSKENNTITGNLVGSGWFKIYCEGNKIFCIKNENTEVISENEKVQPNYYIFGMGLRNKYIIKMIADGSYMFYKYGEENNVILKLNKVKITAEEYKVSGINEFGKEIVIYENGDGIFYSIEDKIETIEDAVKINIPDFSSNTYSKQLKILFAEIMINITKDGPTPNFIAYPNVWYRDAASICMVLEKTKNINQVEDWIKNITKIYDENNGRKEYDNLGQILYMMSLIDNKNQDTINKIIEESNNLIKEKNYLNGITDGGYHPIYQTKWLKYGMECLGMDTSHIIVPKIYDSYEDLMWFYKDKDISIDRDKISNRWLYLQYARLHYYNIEDKDIINLDYPISSEYNPAKADFKNLKHLDKNLYENKLVQPHAWSAAEMFLYINEL